MKSTAYVTERPISASHPARGAWIEIPINSHMPLILSSSHPARGAWIEIAAARCRTIAPMSHPARGAWIEIWVYDNLPFALFVAPRKGCVD